MLLLLDVVVAAGTGRKCAARSCALLTLLDWTTSTPAVEDGPTASARIHDTSAMTMTLHTVGLIVGSVTMASDETCHPQSSNTSWACTMLDSRCIIIVHPSVHNVTACRSCFSSRLLSWSSASEGKSASNLASTGALQP